MAAGEFFAQWEFFSKACVRARVVAADGEVALFPDHANSFAPHMDVYRDAVAIARTLREPTQRHISCTRHRHRLEAAMNVRPSILCPIDYSDASAGALRYAAAIA